MTNLPEPLTLLESIEQFKLLWWNLIYNMHPARYTDAKRTAAWASCLSIRSDMVGLQDAWRDYSEGSLT